jgi:GGDEF domain-containing protein
MTSSHDQDELYRLESLRSLDVLDTPAEERFDRITRLATRLFGVPIAIISLVDEERQWFKSRQGLALCEADRKGSLCSEAIQGRATLVVPDASKDERFKDSPMVTGEHAIRFYAGHPLADREGRRLGTLCIADRTPRELDEAEIQDLHDLAKIAQQELCPQIAGLGHVEMIGGKSRTERNELIDPVTALWKPKGMLEVLRFGLVRARYERVPCAVIRAQFASPVEIGDQQDRVRSEIAQVLRRGVRAHDAVGIWEQDQFLVVLFSCSRAAADARALQLRNDVEDALTREELRVEMTQGWAAFDPDDPLEAEALIEKSGVALELARSAGPGNIFAA